MMKNKLLSHLHRVYDKDPHAVLALRIRHPSILVWSVSSRELSLSLKSGKALGVIPLSGLRLSDLARKLNELGCTVEYLNPTLQDRLADALLEGSGREDTSNGDHLYCYDSLLWALVDAVAFELDDVKSNGVVEALKQAYLHSADGFWVDFWGGFFGVYRISGETDESYLLRILAETCRIRCNSTAIRLTIKELTGIDVYIHEMWEEIFTLDYSELSGSHAFCDGVYYTWGVIEPIVYQPLTDEQRKQIRQIIERNRMGGCVATDPTESASYVIQRDIDYSSMFYQTYKSVTWADKGSWTGKWTDKKLYGMSIAMSVRSLMDEVETGLFVLKQNIDYAVVTSQEYRPVTWTIGHDWTVGKWTDMKQVGMSIAMSIS
ncbi:hypothetical protein OFAG_00789 [Oxalobacter formigenes HOxBLS]|uniref:Uncharacterized protein n=2 Tax=Oxalobacter paraformigenes TaxID=556268 RepID=C3X350_9BURK|nr:hypothetical protein [Oxalobacter paraformigenes]EEO27636.2 hypothetical protein OFAG_00789 [Oxalobacter paraformigenes]